MSTREMYEVMDKLENKLIALTEKLLADPDDEDAERAYDRTAEDYLRVRRRLLGVI